MDARLCLHVVLKNGMLCLRMSPAALNVFEMISACCVSFLRLPAAASHLGPAPGAALGVLSVESPPTSSVWC